MFSDVPAIFAFDGTEERTQVVIGPLAGFGADKVVGNALMEGGQADRPPPNLSRIEILDNQVLTHILW